MGRSNLIFDSWPFCLFHLDFDAVLSLKEVITKGINTSNYCQFYCDFHYNKIPFSVVTCLIRLSYE